MHSELSGGQNFNQLFVGYITNDTQQRVGEERKVDEHSTVLLVGQGSIPVDS